jgi:hypothetical protein
MSLPIDTSRVKFLTGDDVKPQIVYETGAQKTTRDGQPIFQVPIVAFPAGGVAEILKVKVLGEPKGLQLHAPVRVVGLEVRPWTARDGSGAGLAYWASAIEPETAAAAAPASK